MVVQGSLSDTWSFHRRQLQKLRLGKRRWLVEERLLQVGSSGVLSN